MQLRPTEFVRGTDFLRRIVLLGEFRAKREISDEHSVSIRWDGNCVVFESCIT